MAATAKAATVEAVAEAARLDEELKGVSAELARAKAHAAIAIHQSDDELSAVKVELAAASSRADGLAREVESLRRSLEVSTEAGEEEMRTRLEAAIDEAARKEASLQELLLEEKARARAAAEEAELAREATRHLESERRSMSQRWEQRARAAETEAGELRVQLAASAPNSAAPPGSAEVRTGVQPLEGALAAANGKIAEQLDTIERLQLNLNSAQQQLLSGVSGGVGVAAPGAELETYATAMASGVVLQSILSGSEPSHNPSAPSSASATSSGTGAGPRAHGGDIGGIDVSGRYVSGSSLAAVTRRAAEAEAELRERTQEIDFLRHELNELQAALRRSEKAINLTFLKNILVRYLKDGDLENSLPALAAALEMSPQEVAEIRQQQMGTLRGVGRAFRLW